MTNQKKTKKEAPELSPTKEMIDEAQYLFAKLIYEIQNMRDEMNGTGSGIVTGEAQKSFTSASLAEKKTYLQLAMSIMIALKLPPDVLLKQLHEAFGISSSPKAASKPASSILVS
jgi:hypothetical protein